MSAQHNASGSFALLLCRQVKFVNTFQTSTDNFNAHYKIAPNLNRRFTHAYLRGTKNGEIYSGYVLNVDSDVSNRA